MDSKGRIYFTVLFLMSRAIWARNRFLYSFCGKPVTDHPGAHGQRIDVARITFKTGTDENSHVGRLYA